MGISRITQTLAREPLQRSWCRAWNSVGAPNGNHDLFDQLLACYQAPQRKYHTIQHLNECIATLEPALDLAAHPGEVEVALWFHDAVYDIKQQDNERRSALWAKDASLSVGLTAESADRIYGLVMATRHDALPSSTDERLLTDVDIAILGASAERFEEYECQIRQEYSEVPTEVFCRKRLAILRQFLARPFIYSTEYFRAILESPARRNLQYSASRLGG